MNLWSERDLLTPALALEAIVVIREEGRGRM